jgi:hypothetical protein
VRLVARLACCGFEWYRLPDATEFWAASPDFAAPDVGAVDSNEYDTILLYPGWMRTQRHRVRSGVRALALRPTVMSNGSACRIGGTWTWTASTTYYFRCYYCLGGLPAAPAPIMAPGSDADGTRPAQVRLTPAGTLQLWDMTSGSGVQIGSDWTGTVTADTITWYRVEMSVTLDSAGRVASAALRVNGTAVASGSITTPAALATPCVAAGWLAADTATPFMFLDDAAVNDSSGASENTWCGDGCLVLLAPVADSARGVNWTAGTGGTANLWRGTRATPPNGHALASATADSQIKNQASDNTGNYDAACTPYAHAAIPPDATVKLVMGVAIHGCSVTNGVAGALRLVSNPAAGGEASLTAASVPSDWPAGWSKVPASAAQAAALVVYGDIPAGNRGAGPVLRAGKRQNSTRVLTMCAMGAHVEVDKLTKKWTGFNTTIGQAVTHAATW